MKGRKERMRMKGSYEVSNCKTVKRAVLMKEEKRREKPTA